MDDKFYLGPSIKYIHRIFGIFWPPSPFVCKLGQSAVLNSCNLTYYVQFLAQPHLHLSLWMYLIDGPSVCFIYRGLLDCVLYVWWSLFLL